MKKKSTEMTNAVITGMMVGAAAGMMLKSMMIPKKKKISKSAGKAIGAVGEVMQNVSSFIK